MLRKFLASLLVAATSFLTASSQTASSQTASAPPPPQAKLTRADFLKPVAAQPVDFEKEIAKSPTRKSSFSGGAKTALWIALLAGGIATVVILATGDKKDTNNSPCTAQVGVPCPPGCVCIQ